ncbi:dienelactone hydrolase [Phenylobacterium sp.]|jgi:predicted dienelactone hydrolase|uniref:alpha/beta hydrolase family protein n=1 Tax=Phenylobacterium sp. TaxID=1871053 RepID=UPI002F3F2963
MRQLSLFAAALAAACVAALVPTLAAAGVGFQHFNIPDPKGGAPLEVGVWYPTASSGKPQPLELYTQTVAPDAPVRGHGHVLIVMSHGHGGSYAGHHDTAEALAEAGFVAASVTHNGDSWKDSSRATHLEDRPYQLEVLTNYMLDRWPGHDRLATDRIGAFGFSAGGFTVLTLAGGEPDLSTLKDHCRERPAFTDCQIVAAAKFDFTAPRVWTHDPRVKAVVSASPAIGFAFGKAGLAKITAKVQLWRGEDDPVLPNPFYAEAVRKDLPVPPEMHVIPHMGHYEFLAPCPPAMTRAEPEICAHEDGFDPVAFHARFKKDVVRFFRAALKAPGNDGRSRPG